MSLSEPTEQDLLADVPDVLLYGPGPSPVSGRVSAALAAPTLGHLDPTFITLMDRIKQMLRQVMGTANEMTLPVSGTGSAGMEACFANLVTPGTRVLVLVNGVFGGRMAEVATRLGAEVETLAFDWGTPDRPEAVSQKLSARTYDLVAMVHAETSTGVANPAQAVGELLHDRQPDAFYVLDTVTSLGGMPVEMDAWHVDALYSGTQKCLSCPPGLAPLSVSARAVERVLSRETKVPNWYLDLSLLAGYWAGAKRSYHHTAPINMNYGLYRALCDLLDEGLEAAFARHRAAHERLVAGLEDLGLRMLVEPEARLPMLNTVKVPDGVDEARVRSRLREEHHVEIGAGLGPLAGKVWRVGVMGHGARPEPVDRCLSALRAVL